MALANPGALLIGVPEAGRRLGIPRNKAYEWCRKGILPHARDGGRIYVPARAVDNLVERIEQGQWPGDEEILVRREYQSGGRYGKQARGR